MKVVAKIFLLLTVVTLVELYLLLQLSFQRYGLAELIAGKGEWIGVDNYTRILHDGQFLTEHLRREHLTEADVLQAMREHGVEEAAQVARKMPPSLGADFQTPPKSSIWRVWRRS